jgi:hypothetical protein
MREIIPPLGTIRYVKRFAWRRTRVGDTIIWLESYFEKQQVQEFLFPHSFNWRAISLHLPEDVELSPLSKALE